MNIIIVLYLIICMTTKLFADVDSTLRVTLPNTSKLIGTYLTSQNGNQFRAFMGIPYAQPPLGNLRFRAPLPANPWNGEREFIVDGEICTQWNPYLSTVNVAGSEDCLFLNVYTTKHINNKQALPVMVFFHGGAFIYGSGMKHNYGPEYLLDNDNNIIYVGVNYRLAQLGFLSTGQSDCPGNFGLKDQVMALKWIQQNIHAFGGDSNRVTIFGESAGGASVTYLMMSPLANGLFHRAIAQSGTNMMPWAAPDTIDDAKQKILKVGKLLNCNRGNSAGNSNWKILIDCLRTKSAEDIIRTYPEFYEWTIDPLTPFPPVIEQPSSGAFITQHPRNINSSHGDSIPLLIGVNLNEGLAKTPSMFFIPQLFADVQNNWTTILPIILYYKQQNQQCKRIENEITQRLNRFYMGNCNQFITQDNFYDVANLISDGWVIAGFDEYMRKRLTRKNRDQPTYVYLLQHQGVSSFTEIYGGRPGVQYGVCHGDDLQYLFPLSFFVNNVPSSTDLQIRNIFIQSWISFAANGNPKSSQLNIPNWRPAVDYPYEYLRIGNLHEESKPLIGMERNMFSERVRFWNDLRTDYLLS